MTGLPCYCLALSVDHMAGAPGCEFTADFISRDPTEPDYWHSTVTVLVAGALESEETFSTADAAVAYVAAQIAAARSDTINDTAIYELVHGHNAPEDGECACAQYAQDHRPIFEYDPRADNGQDGAQ